MYSMDISVIYIYIMLLEKTESKKKETFIVIYGSTFLSQILCFSFYLMDHLSCYHGNMNMNILFV